MLTALFFIALLFIVSVLIFRLIKAALLQYLIEDHSNDQDQDLESFKKSVSQIYKVKE